ncbi:hypothetical protein MNBD_GAMMA26-865 [hydrothermal vent metagenome]|uniref:Uncharacterized protein n=1 Tax=hydrothermal vent metagenome TaxID=652676 RepID=A0A3B1AYV4_9ZZZZ
MKGLNRVVGPLAPALIVIGGLIYAITGEMSTLAISLIWVGLLLLLLFLYVGFSDIRELIAKRSTKYAANTAIMTIIFVVVVGMISVMSVRYKVRVDLTENSRYTLSAQTVKILKSLKKDVEVVAFYRSDERTRQAMYDLLKEYAYYSSKFTFRFVDPDKNPAETIKYGITSYRTTVFSYGTKTEVVGTESESRMTNALIRLLTDDVKTIYFVTGHGEKDINSKQGDGYSQVKDAIEKENHQVKKLLLMSVDQVPKNAAAIVLNGPETNLLPSELDKITAYLGRGGRVLFMLDPGSGASLSSYLAGFGFEIGNNLIIDKLSQVYGANYLTPVVVEYNKDHILTNEFTVATFYPAAQSVSIKEEPAKGSYNLAKTSVNSWAITGELTDENLQYDPDRHRRGPLTVVAVAAVEVNVSEANADNNNASIKKWGKIVVTGDSDFAGNTHLKLAGNKDFFLNMLNWLAEENVLISIRKTEPGLTPLMLSNVQGKLVFWLSVVIVPSLVMMVGIGVFLRKRRVV